MEQKKRRILLCNDTHFLHSGYAKYGKEVLTRLAATEKYILAELACYGAVGDERDVNANWVYYANHVNSQHPLYNLYISHPQNEFGKWRFERTCLDFKPDIVCDIRDPWMSIFECMSPLRPYYNWTIMPTVDSAPQRNTWLEIFAEADGVFTYSDWGLNVLNTESNNTIKTVGTASPGCDINVFTPVRDKNEHRRMMGFFTDCNIIGTIMRNQNRKLYPDLFIAFKKFINYCYNTGNKDLAEKTYLYLHCSYPDMGWDIPELLLEHELGRKVIFTYVCRLCNRPFCAFFSDARTICPQCNLPSATLPNTVLGLSPHNLSQVLNLFDVYIQYSVCEGFGMPQVEAASCGIPVMAVDYSAMSDIVRKLEGIPLKVQRMFRDMGTDSYRALPDNDACAEEIYKFFRKPDAIRRQMGHRARKAVEQYYTWDNTAKTWESYLDKVQLHDLQGQWNAPKRNIISPPSIPTNMSNADFVDWCIVNVMQEPRFLYTKFAMKYTSQLNYGMQMVERETRPVTQQIIYDTFMCYYLNKKECEEARTGELPLDTTDYIEYAHQRAEYL